MTRETWVQKTIGLISIFIVFTLGLTMIHELIHVSFDVLFTEGQLFNCGSGFPISYDISSMNVNFFACVSGQHGGYNALLATTITSLLALGIAWKSREYADVELRHGLLITGLYVWWRYALYSMGILAQPQFGENGLWFAMGDGRAILEAFGPIGLVPGYIIMAIGSVVLFYRIGEEWYFTFHADKLYQR